MKVFRLEGSSMLPLFRPGQAVAVGPGRPRPGDCAVYTYGGRNLLHRVAEVSRGGAVFVDDAGRLEPHYVAWAEVRGTVLDGGPLAGGLPGRCYSSLRRALYAVNPFN
ncbi:MAG: hypothetical protein A2X29_06825 [Elusimicrobia bacterium GWA2_64_40]|nr:MAG: hypothetical protein A2X29_06825 [Elusimicrobia bacterium GWA2_64_40]OGR66114.1 MAG: hypothetical protein A2X30_09760 [Elusimicrobia bacterium GWB2_63_16]